MNWRFPRSHVSFAVRVGILLQYQHSAVTVPLLTLDQVSLAFGHLPLFEEAELRVEPGERIALIGRNGSGKSSLLKIVAGDMPPDGGTIWRSPGLRRRPARAGRAGRSGPHRVRRGGRGSWRAWRGGRGLPSRRHRMSLTARQGSGGRARPRLGALQQSSKSRTAGASSRRSRLVVVEAGASGRSADARAVRRMAPARAPWQGARVRAGPAAARRAHEPSRHRRDPVAGGAPARLTPARCCSSRTTARSSRTSPRGSSSSIAAASRPGPARIRPTCEKKADALETEARDLDDSTRSSRRKRRGCGRASRRGGHATKGA